MPLYIINDYFATCFVLYAIITVGKNINCWYFKVKGLSKTFGPKNELGFFGLLINKLYLCSPRSHLCSICCPTWWSSNSAITDMSCKFQLHYTTDWRGGREPGNRSFWKHHTCLLTNYSNTTLLGKHTTAHTFTHLPLCHIIPLNFTSVTFKHFYEQTLGKPKLPLKCPFFLTGMIK